MRIGDAKKVVRRLIELDVPVLLFGHAGIGKTQMVKQIGRELGMQIKIVVLSKFEQGDLMGLPVISGDKTVYLRPEWLPNEPNTILFLDEINRAPIYLRQGILELVQERQIGDFKLPEGCRIVAAANPDTEEYIVTDINDQALLTRFVLLSVTNDTADFADFLINDEVDADLALAAVGTLDHIGAFRKDVPLPQIYPNPRAFHRLVKIYKAISDFQEELQLEIITGIVGVSAAAEFMRRIKSKVLTKEDFFEAKTERIKKAPLVEKVFVFTQIMRDKEIDNVPIEALDVLTDEELISIFRNLAQYSNEVHKEFAKLRNKYRRIHDLIVSIRI